MPENIESVADGATRTSKPKKKRSLLARVRFAFLCVVLVLLVMVHPRVFPHVIGGLFRFEAWRNGVSLDVGRIEAGLFDPVVLRDTVWTYRAETGAVTRVEIRRARAWLAWGNIFPEPIAGWIRSGAVSAGFEPIGRNGLWFPELEVEGLTAKLSLPGASSSDSENASNTRWLHSVFGRPAARPGLITVKNADIIVERDGRYVRMEGASFTLSELDPGNLRATQLIWKVDGVKNVFRDIRARTSMQDARVTLSGLRLDPAVTVDTFSITATDIAAGKIMIATRIAAFGGELEAEAATAIAGGQLRFDVNGSLSNIDIGGLAVFLGLSEAAGGILNEGHFNVRGTPRDMTNAEATLRLEAGAFQWESRQWDSLVLGMSLLDQRLHVPELRLRQGKNQLTLKGSMGLPQPGTKWWERQFDFKVDADLGNLTDLSALVLPDFQYTAGHLLLRGTLSSTGARDGKPPEYEGQILVNGSDLQWRTAPLGVLQGALAFHGSELEIVTAQCIHDDDFLRGTGRISLLDGSYSGEWRLSARDIAAYKAVLTPWILPVALGGGVDMAWTGRGDAGVHNGKFSAMLRKFRLLGPGGTLPLDAETRGTYRPAQVQLEQLRLAEGGTSLTAGVSIGPSAVNVRGLRVERQNHVCLQGDAFLAFDLWQRWPDVNFTRLLNDETVSSIRLTATDLDLGAASRLTGIDWPLKGTVTGNLQADGALNSLKLGGSANLSSARLPLNWKGSFVHDVNAAFAFEGASVRLEKGTGKHAGGDFTLAGKLDLANPRTPSIDVEGSGTHAEQPFQFTVKGPAAKPVIVTQGASPFPGIPVVQPQPRPASAQN